MATITEVQRPFTATQERQLQQSQEPEASQPTTTTGQNRDLSPLTPNPEDPSGPSREPSPEEGLPQQPRGGGPPGGGPPDDQDPSDHGGEPDQPSDDSSSEPELSTKNLAQAIIALSKGNKAPSKTSFKPREPDAFDGSSPQKLRTFIFQCQVYFNARRNEFSEDTDRVYFAISYLTGAALDYFEPFINEPDPENTYDFFSD